MKTFSSFHLNLIRLWRTSMIRANTKSGIKVFQRFKQCNNMNTERIVMRFAVYFLTDPSAAKGRGK
ncbi:hypothetical protein CKO35_00015 [Ectothiorhodospira shaposhnikovii]|nr:hypothetical protein [Ectothiorhodospira shaposhnikovii]